MLSPLERLEGAVIRWAGHNPHLDSLRLEFQGSAALIAYNACVVGGGVVRIDDSPREFPALVGAVVESIVRTERHLRINLSSGRDVVIGMSNEDIAGPEAFQIMLPGYPPVVEQNP